MPHNLLKSISGYSFAALLACTSLQPAFAGAPAESGQQQEMPDDAAAQKSALMPETGKDKADAASFGTYLSGRFAESLGDTGNGIHFLRESLKNDPANKDVMASLYRMLILSGEISEAVQLAHKLTGTKVVEDGSEFSPAMMLAVNEIRQGHFSEASKYLQSVPKAGFNSLLVPLLQQWIKLGENEIKAPVEAKDMAPSGHAILPHVYLNAAFIDDIAGFGAEAQKQYEEAIKDPRIEPFRAVEALANYDTRKGLDAKRQQLISDYLAAHGDSFLADELLSEPPQKHPAPLVANATEGAAEVFYAVANIFHGVRAPADEIATLHLALYLRPHFPPAQFLLASAYELAQDYPSAIAAYKSIAGDSPYYVRGRIRSVYDESEMGKKQQALGELDEIAAARPHDVDALLAKGDILRSENRFKEAEVAYDAAAQRVGKPQKQDWIIYFSRGTCFERMGQWDKAESDMKKALSLNPNEPEILNYLGYSWLTQHRHLAEAKKMIEDAYDARPEDAHIIDSMGYALYVGGDFASAQEYFEQALERTPNDPTVNDHLGDTYWQLGRKVEARFQWERALADKPDADTERDLHKKLDKGLAMVHPVQAVEGKKPVTAEPATDE